MLAALNPAPTVSCPLPCTGNCTLSEDIANEMAIAFARKHFVVFERSESGEEGEERPTSCFTSVPPATRGIPHSYIPGVHSMTRPYCDFIETYRELSGRQHADTVDSVMVLPFSAFTQGLRPDLEASSDSSLRTCFREEMETSVATGRAHLVDSTAESMAIVTEPLFRRPCQVSCGDCPFATSYEAMDSFFNCCNALALLARSACHSLTTSSASPSECVSHLHKIINAFVYGSKKSGAHPTKRSVVEAAWAADALLFLNVLYPTDTVVGELAILPGIAKAPPHCQRLLHSGEASCPVVLEQVNVSNEERARVRQFWSGFCRPEMDRCAWTWGVAPFLTLILSQNGSHKTEPEVIAQFRKGLETAVRAVWLVHSPDGVSRPPDNCAASDASDPMHLSRHHIDPVFVGDEEQNITQRGCLVGLKPHSYRQILAEMMGAFLDGVDCNVAINEGGLSLRVSSDATILDEDGNERTEKSISPVQTEGDEAAYGTRANKINGAVLQKNAWDTNAILGMPLFSAVDPPRDIGVRERGEFGFSDFFQMEAQTRIREQQLQSDDYRNAAELIRKAAVPTVATVVNRVL